LVKYREFLRHPGRYLEIGAEIVIEDRGICVCVRQSDSHITGETPAPPPTEQSAPDPEVEDAPLTIDFADKELRMTQHGCGCAKVEGHPMCKQHGRY